MNRFIEELRKGNIDLQARNSEQNKKVRHDMQKLNQSNDDLPGKLSDDAWATV